MKVRSLSVPINQSPELFSSLILVTAVVPFDYHNKMPQRVGLKTTVVSSPTGLKNKIKVVEGSCSHLVL